MGAVRRAYRAGGYTSRELLPLLEASMVEPGLLDTLRELVGAAARL